MTNIGLRMAENDVELIKRICEARGENLSNFIRRTIKMELARLSYLSNEEKKALGFTSVSVYKIASTKPRRS